MGQDEGSPGMSQPRFSRGVVRKLTFKDRVCDKGSHELYFVDEVFIKSLDWKSRLMVTA